MKWLHLITVFIFGSFVYVNLNDADFLKWALFYSPMIMIALVHIFRKIPTPFFVFYYIMLVTVLILNINNLVDWFTSGMPSIFELETENVEGVREFLGISIALIFALFYWQLNKRRYV